MPLRISFCAPIGRRLLRLFRHERERPFVVTREQSSQLDNHSFEEEIPPMKSFHFHFFTIGGFVPSGGRRLSPAGSKDVRQSKALLHLVATGGGISSGLCKQG